MSQNSRGFSASVFLREYSLTALCQSEVHASVVFRELICVGTFANEFLPELIAMTNRSAPLFSLIM